MSIVRLSLIVSETKDMAELVGHDTVPKRFLANILEVPLVQEGLVAVSGVGEKGVCKHGFVV